MIVVKDVRMDELKRVKRKYYRPKTEAERKRNRQGKNEKHWVRKPRKRK